MAPPCPCAVSGSNGSGATFDVVLKLSRGFALLLDDALTLMEQWNQTCDPPWTTYELMHKLEESEKIACTDPHGWMLVKKERESPFEGFSIDMTDFDIENE